MEAAPLSQSKAEGRTSSRMRAPIATVAALAAGGWLRIWMMRHFLETNGDTAVYGDIAKNLLEHGRYALTLGSGQAFLTLIRLPGYPFFLAACFRLFGVGNYAAVVALQIAMELAGCLLLADIARRIVPDRLASAAFHATLWLSILCPFTAVYAANPLTECPTLFSIALALWTACRFQQRASWPLALTFTGAVTFAALLRPDGALVALALAPALLLRADTQPRRGGPAKRLAAMALLCALLALSPFAVWTLRNWVVFHVVQPLAPRSATDPGDPLTPGWDRWVATWCLDFISTYNVVWNVPGDVLDIGKLPSRAFDSPAQYRETAAVASQYNSNDYNVTPAIDAEFAQLADQRIAAHPLRSWLWLPIGRVADMWLRPRVENLPIDIDWWVYAHHHVETRFSWAYAALNALYLLLGLAGLFLRPRLAVWMLAYMLVRSALLLTVTPPEARYTLECFPMLFVLGGVALGWVFARLARIKPA
ncbi:MAG TPA: glycosyltransferase family 39 protein [Terracidiphilus sp.]|nr:glycosyltransferase family 39 protein [Terracidiphilus sp.]